MISNKNSSIAVNKCIIKNHANVKKGVIFCSWVEGKKMKLHFLFFNSCSGLLFFGFGPAFFFFLFSSVDK